MDVAPGQLVRRSALFSILALLSASLLVVAGATQVFAENSTAQGTLKVGGGLLDSITTSPLTLTPTFDPTITDYVLRCQTGVNTIQFSLNARAGESISLGGNQGQTVVVQESLVENQALIVNAVAWRLPPTGFEIGAWERVDYWIRCLPHDFPQLSVSRPGSPPAGWYLTGNFASAVGSGPYAMVLDNHGTPVWYRRSSGPNAINVTPLPGGTIAWWALPTQGFGSDPAGSFVQYGLATQTTSSLQAPIPPTDPHELHLMPNGNLMMLSTPLRSHVDMTTLGGSSRAIIVDCVVEETDPRGGLLWQWRASDHISVGESTHPMPAQVNGRTVYDIYHCNSIDTDPISGNILLSSRHTDAIYLISRATGRVLWKLGGNTISHEGARVTVIGDPDGSFHAQHDARFQPNGNISLYDDQSWNVSLAARGVEYRINPTAGTARLVWSFLSPDGLNSPATGSFCRLSGGTDNVIGWGYGKSILFTEVDSAGNTMLTVRFTNGEWAYRVIKVGPASLSLALMRSTAGLP
jgi:Arylsulfotransferase (ASST)